MTYYWILGLAIVLTSCSCTTTNTNDGTGAQQAGELFSGDSCRDLALHDDGTCDRFCLTADPDCSGLPDLTDRADEVIAELDRFNAGLSEDGRQGKYCKMAASPFVFFRGSNHLYWRDLASDRRLEVFGGDRTRTWLQGDLHAYNYGAFDNDDGVVVYDLNDFDEVVIADYQLDLWRLATSLVLIAEHNGGFSSGDVDDILDRLTESYLDAVASYRGNGGENDAIFDKNTTYGLLDDFLAELEKKESRREMLDKWTDEVAGARRFDTSLARLAPVDPATDAEIRGAMAGYITTVARRLQDDPGYFQVKDIALRLDAGTGSLGVARYYVLIEGASEGQNNDRILDVKQQGQPSAYPYLDAIERALLASFADNQARRTIVGYRALAANADDHLGWMNLSDGVYSIRERSPYKEPFPAETLDSKGRFVNLAAQWGAVLATAHSRADKDHDEALIPYSFDKEVDVLTDTRHDEVRALVREIAVTYATQVHRDFRSFQGHVAEMCP